jgi:hypothetical protein
MDNFKPLTKALDKWFDRALRDLPEELRDRVEDEFSPMPWDRLSPGDRRKICMQLDSYDDPSSEGMRQHYSELADTVTNFEASITEWKSKLAPTAIDQDIKDRKLEALHQQLQRIKDENCANGAPVFPPRSLSRKPENAKVVKSPATKPSYSGLRRELRKQETNEKYKAWNKAYRELSKKHPGKTDTWISKQIQKTDIGDGKTAETIRRKMKS